MDSAFPMRAAKRRDARREAVRARQRRDKHSSYLHSFAFSKICVHDSKHFALALCVENFATHYTAKKDFSAAASNFMFVAGFLMRCIILHK